MLQHGFMAKINIIIGKKKAQRFAFQHVLIDIAKLLNVA